MQKKLNIFRSVVLSLVILIFYMRLSVGYYMNLAPVSLREAVESEPLSSEIAEVKMSRPYDVDRAISQGHFASNLLAPPAITETIFYKALLEEERVVVKDLIGKRLRSFRYVRDIPKVVLGIIEEGRVGTIEQLRVGDDNILRLRPTMIYDFTAKGDYSGKTITAHFDGSFVPHSFSVFLDAGNTVDMHAEEVRILPMKLSEGAFIFGRDAGEIIGADGVVPDSKVSEAEQQEISEAIELALENVPNEQKNLARKLFSAIPECYNRHGRLVLDLLAEKVGVTEEEVMRVFKRLSETETLQKMGALYVRERASKKARYLKRDVYDPPPIPEDYKVYARGKKKVYIRDMETGEYSTLTMREFKDLYHNKKLGTVEVIYYPLNSGGELSLGLDANRKLTIVYTFVNFPNKNTRFIVKNGTIKRNSIILLDEKGLPLKDNKLRYAKNPDTGEIYCHLATLISEDTLTHLDGLDVYAQLDSNGGLYFGASGRILTFSEYPRQKVKFKVVGGKVDRQSILLLDDNLEVLQGYGRRHMIDPITGKVQCHLPRIISRETYKELEGMTIYDRLNKNGFVVKGSRDSEHIPVYTFHGKGKIKYRIKNGKIDPASVILLNEDGTVYADNRLRYAVSPKTGKIVCHIPNNCEKTFFNRLNGFVIYDRLDNTGYLSFGKMRKKRTSVIGFANFPGQRVMYYLNANKVDIRSIKLLNEDGTVYMNNYLRYAKDPKTGAFCCHLPDSLMKMHLEIYNGLDVYTQLGGDGRVLLLVCDDRGKLVSRSVGFRSKPGHRVKYNIKNNAADEMSIQLLTRDDQQIADDCRYIVDLFTGQVQTHVQGKVHEKWLKKINAVEVHGGRLSKLGNLSFGEIRYFNFKYAGKKVRYKIFHSKVVLVSIMDEENIILEEHILDERLHSRMNASIGRTDHYRTISYSMFMDQIFRWYEETILVGDNLSTNKELVQKLYRLLDSNVFFFFGSNLAMEAQLRLKSGIYALWKDIIGGMPSENIHQRLVFIAMEFEQGLHIQPGAGQDDIDGMEAELLSMIKEYSALMLEKGLRHRRNIELPEPNMPPIIVDDRSTCTSL